MKTLNLVYPEKSDIKYRIDKFPDGQQQVIILSNPFSTKGWLSIEASTTNWRQVLNKSVQISSRLNNFMDLELIICATKSLRNLGVKEIRLYIPSFLGSRSDRKFEEGSNNYLKDVICPIINGLNFESVTVIDPHSDVLEACLNNFDKLNSNRLIAFSIGEIYKNYSTIDKYNNNFLLISPDAGASKKIFKTAEILKYTGDIITCSKDRGVDGKLNKTVVPLTGSVRKDAIIIDDICDGGATFINIAKELQKQELDGKIYLIVTHGIFSKGFEELSKYFDGIFCTNSVKDITFPWSLKGYLGRNSQVLNVFS